MRKYKNGTFVFLWICVAVMLASSCSTRKNTFFHRAYHGTTARYNIYFNGSESFKKADEEISHLIRDDYTNILPVYPTADRQQALQSSPHLDRAIEKCSKAIYKHSILIRGVEYSKPIDDAYMLMGRAYFLRQDYADALNVFSYIVNTHKNGNVWVDAFTWKARTYIKMGNIEEAEANLEEIRYPVSVHRKSSYRLHWESTFAQVLLDKKDYDNAPIYLQEALKHKRIKKDFKTRLRYILAQIQQKTDQPEEAAKQYAMVLKRNPPYEMQFNAAINLSLCSPDNQKDKQTARSHLKKMFKDDRNEAYRDQIFYALALLDVRDEDTASAIKNLEASIFWSINNPYQKTTSALLLADIYFAQDQYIIAQKHYDTAINNLPTSFPDYAVLKKRVGILRNLVEQLSIVAREDSLQKIANLPEGERERYIDQLIADYLIAEAARIADEEEKAALLENANTRARANSGSGNQVSKWPFYNPTQVKLGEQTFRKRWGTRTLSDYWAFSALTSSNTFSQSVDNASDTPQTEEMPEESNESQDPTGRTINPTTREYYLQDAPLTEEKMQASHQAIAGALYNSGIIYKDDLKDIPKGVTQWESLFNRYPENKLYPSACYQLYQTYKEINNIPKSDYYKNILLEKFPNTDYAALIRNPNYYLEIEQMAKEAEDFYGLVYEFYQKEDYQSVATQATEGLDKYKSPELRPKFAYLHAVASGKLYGLDTMAVKLEQVSINYPMTAIDTAATELLEAIKRINIPQTQEIKQETQATIELPTYQYKPENFHFIVFVVNIKDTKIDPLKNKIYNFNKDFFRFQQFEISNIYLDEVSQMVTISNFENKDKAMDYYNLLKADNKYYKELNQTPSAKVYVISDNNYKVFYKNKNLRPDYDVFFNKNYLIAQ